MSSVNAECVKLSLQREGVASWTAFSPSSSFSPKASVITSPFPEILAPATTAESTDHPSAVAVVPPKGRPPLRRQPHRPKPPTYCCLEGCSNIADERKLTSFRGSPELKPQHVGTRPDELFICSYHYKRAYAASQAMKLAAAKEKSRADLAALLPFQMGLFLGLMYGSSPWPAQTMMSSIMGSSTCGFLPPQPSPNSPLTNSSFGLSTPLCSSPIPAHAPSDFSLVDAMTFPRLATSAEVSPTITDVQPPTVRGNESNESVEFQTASSTFSNNGFDLTSFDFDSFDADLEQLLGEGSAGAPSANETPEIQQIPSDYHVPSFSPTSFSVDSFPIEEFFDDISAEFCGLSDEPPLKRFKT